MLRGDGLEMKSKAEIIDALKQCNDIQYHCIECPYDRNNSRAECVDELFNDIITLLSKSDFEVMEEIFCKSNKTFCGEYTAANGHHVLEIHPRLDDDYRTLIRFDEEGNIV